jgi:hypothetical protein
VIPDLGVDGKHLAILRHARVHNLGHTTRPSRTEQGEAVVLGVGTIRSSDKHVFEMLGHLAVGDFCQILSDLADDFGANAVGDRCPQIA